MKDKTVLLVDDDKKVLFLLSDALTQYGFKVSTATLPSEALKILRESAVDAVVLDLVMPNIDGLTTLQNMKKIKPALPVIMLSGQGTIEKAVKSLKLGAYDFLEKPVSSDKIAVCLKNAITQAGLQEDTHHLLHSVQEKYRMIGHSKALQAVFRLIDKMAPTDSPVLITGESGTGKELVARALHLKSPRAAKSFEALNCAAIPEELMESELFGHEKGAFTGAADSKPGLFEQAHNGTLFLDEISDMSLKLQPKFLRALETMEIKRVGGTVSKKINARIIAATNKNLVQAINEKTFREDLFYRISVLTIHVPPLRERREDIPLLTGHFLEHVCSRRKKETIVIHPHTMELLMEYPWPGNVRQLKNLVEKIVVLADSPEILPEAVQPYLNLEGTDGKVGSIGEEETLEQARKRVEKDKLLAKLHTMNWDYKAAADELGISRATLFNKMKAYGITGKRNR